MIFNLANYSYNNYQVTIYPVIEVFLEGKPWNSFLICQSGETTCEDYEQSLLFSQVCHKTKKNSARKRLMLMPCMERSEAEEKKGPDTDFAQKQRLIVIYFPS